MSGGTFDYNQCRIQDIASDLEEIIKTNTIKDEDVYYTDFSDETIEEFKKGLEIIKKAYVYAQRIDWLVACDDGEDSFHRRLKDDLEELNNV